VGSLVAVDVSNWLIRELQADDSVFDILGTLPISAMAVKIAPYQQVSGKQVQHEEVGDGSHQE
jgi:hypothetical protein